MNSRSLPALFVGHGSPMNAIRENEYTRHLREYAGTIPVPSAVAVISAHWLTSGTYITGAARPAQIYDFYGFPDELYDVKYAPPGSPETASLISQECSFVRTDRIRGIDHAAWAVVKHMYPDADIPLLEISLDMGLSPQEHFNRGREFRRFRSGGILFIGSGNMVHNLSIINYDDDARPYDWAVTMDEWIKKHLEENDHSGLINYRRNLKNYRMAIPTDEHYLPMLYVLGLMEEDEKPVFIHESIQNGSISMRSFTTG